MESFERDIQKMEHAIDSLTPPAARELERTMHQLTSEQQAFARRILDAARMTGQVPSHQISLLEHWMETWHAHALATKLAIVGHLSRLAGIEPLAADGALGSLFPPLGMVLGPLRISKDAPSSHRAHAPGGQGMPDSRGACSQSPISA